MAFNDAPGRAEYISSGGQTVFPFSFKIYTDEDVKVYLTPSGQSADDVTDLLMLTNDYTVSINGDLGGTMTLIAGANSGDAVVIQRSLAITRLVDYQTGGDLLAGTLNLDQNYQTYLVADQQAENNRYLTLPASAVGVDTDLPAPTPFNFLQWNGSANALVNVNSLQADGFLWTAADVYTKTESNSTFVNITGDTMLGNLEVPSFSINGVEVSTTTGYKNILINGDKRVNQDAYAGGVLADGVYGYDMWKGADSDANIEQIIEQQNITTGTYTISWVGGGTATIDGNTGLSSGDSVAITVAGNISVKVPKASTDIQLESGTVATSFELRNFAIELSMAQRYYEIYNFSLLFSTYRVNEAFKTINVPFKVEKASPPTMSSITASAGTVDVSPSGLYGFYVNISGANTGGNTTLTNWIANSRL